MLVKAESPAEPATAAAELGASCLGVGEGGVATEPATGAAEQDAQSLTGLMGKEFAFAPGQEDDRLLEFFQVCNSYMEFPRVGFSPGTPEKDPGVPSKHRGVL